MKKAKHLKLGERGEKIARELVRESNGKILNCNYKIYGGEIDIIAWHENTLCFIEVKTRSKIDTESFTRPADAVNFSKKEFLRKAIKSYLNSIPSKNVPYRVDVIEIISPTFWQVNYISWLKSYFLVDLKENKEFKYE